MAYTVYIFVILCVYIVMPSVNAKGGGSPAAKYQDKILKQIARETYKRNRLMYTRVPKHR